MGAGGVSTTVVTEDTSDTTSQRAHAMALPGTGTMLGRAQGSLGVPRGHLEWGRSPGLPHGRPHAGRGLCLAASCAFLGHEFMAAGPWRMGAMGCHGDVRPQPAPILPPAAPTVPRKCSTSSSPQGEWQGSLWVPVPLGGLWVCVPPWQGQAAAARG